MLEVPSLYFQLSALLERVDFLSVGSKDLLLFLFASDRGNPQVGERYDTLSPALLRLLRDVVRMCNNASIPVSLCGEMVDQPLEAMVLIGIGFRHLSMNANAVGGVRLMAAASIQMRLATTSRRSSTAPITASEASCRRSRETRESRSKKLIKLNCIDPYCY
jgi:phosphotransferase system, enzyme I, PtsP